MADQIQHHVEAPEVAAVVITAPAGAGKTRLVREVAARSSTPPVWLQASPAVSGVPFGALAGAVEAAGIAELDAAAAHDAIARLADAGGGVVVVDDAPHLDARTADALRRLVRSGSTTVVATARSGVPVPAWLEWLWLDERTEHINLGPLDRQAIDELVTSVLPDLDRYDQIALAEGVDQRTSGNALFVRELLVELARRRAAGEAVGADVGAPTHLLRVLEARLADAGPEVVAALQAVAVLGSLPLAVLEHVLGPSDAPGVDRAESGGWLSVETGPRARAQAAHPLYAEAALGMLGARARRGLTERVAQAVIEDRGASATERLLATTALVDVGADVSLPTLVEAARTAFAALDHELAVRLALIAIAAGDRFEAHLVAGAAHSGAGRADQAEAALRAALRAAASDDEQARAVGRLSVHLVAHGARIDEAAAMLDEIDASLTDPVARSFLAADQAKLASIRGELAVPASVDDSDELAVLNGAIVTAYAQAMAGDAPACRATIARALPLAEAHRQVLPWSAELVRFSGPFAALLVDGPDAAAEEAGTAAQRTGPAVDATRGTWAFLEGFALAVAGRLEPAGKVLDAAIEALAGHDLISAQHLAVAARAWVAAQAGEVGPARSLIDLAADAASVDGRVAVQVAVADAWCDAAERGEASAAGRRKLLDAAAQARSGGQSLTAALVLHELIRLGGVREAVGAVESLARSMPTSWFVDTIAARARAEAGRDDRALARVATAAGPRWPVMAAEVALVRLQVARASDDAVGSVRAGFDAHRWAESLGPRVPVTVADVADPLTAREREVATAVAMGASNRAVAERAGVSVRTVENQLQSVYRKLGIDGRDALATWFG